MGYRRTCRWITLTALIALICAAPRPAPATIEEQRARLPPAADCLDPVAGVWRSHAWNEMYEEWNIFTLKIRRKAAGSSQLTGTISNEAWYGPKTEVQRGKCEGRLAYLVTMDGQGSVVDGEISFGGFGEWRLEKVHCSDFWGGYNLDQFKGTIDPERLEFQSVNNDGGRFVNVPTVFRRVECLEEKDEDEDGPGVAVTPPAFYPPESSTNEGCGFR